MIGIKYGLIAAARGAFTSRSPMSLNRIVNRHETWSDMWGISEIHKHSSSFTFIHCVTEDATAQIMIIGFIKSILTSLVILAIWLALRGAIYSRIALFFALNRIFFSANENGTVRRVKQNNHQISRLEFNVTNKISGKWKTKSHCVANFANYRLINVKTLLMLSFLFQNNWQIS